MADINQNLKRANDGPVGQHLDANDQLVITGENNPHPTKDKDAHARLDAIEQALGGTLNTQLTGSTAPLEIKPNIVEKYTPLGFKWIDHPLVGKIFKNLNTGEIYTTYDVSDKEYQGTGQTYYVSPTGNNSNDGLSESAPLQSLYTALQKSDVSKILLMDGVYTADIGFVYAIEKDLTIKAINPGSARISMHYNFSWSLESGYTNTYSATRMSSNNTIRVFDNSDTDPYGDYKELTQVADIATVEATPNSFFEDANKVYVHTFDSRPADGNILPHVQKKNLYVNGDHHVYVEGIHFEGGIYPAQIYNGSYFYHKDCSFKYGQDSNGLAVMGAVEVIGQNSIASINTDDGFNYHAANGFTPNAIEIDCVGRYNGIEGNTDNGSTMHDGGSIIRINGQYFRNKGPNIGDVNDGTDSWNIGTVCYGSLATTDTQNSDFTVSTGTPEMWLDSCVAYGSTNSLAVDTLDAKAYVTDSKLSTETLTGVKYEY